MPHDKRKIGKFYVSDEFIYSDEIPKVLAMMGFVPILCQHSSYKSSFSFLGLSHLFDEIDYGDHAPEYFITIHSEENELIRIDVDRVDPDEVITNKKPLTF